MLGAVRFPFGSPDFSSFLLQAQASKAKVIGLAMSGADLLSAIKQAREFGIVQSGQSLASLVIYINDIEGLGLNVAQGLTLTTSFYWDTDDETRAGPSASWSVRAASSPNLITAGTYASVLHYLKAVEAAGNRRGQGGGGQDEGDAGQRLLHTKRPDPADGRVMHKTYLMR